MDEAVCESGRMGMEAPVPPPRGFAGEAGGVNVMCIVMCI